MLEWQQLGANVVFDYPRERPIPESRRRRGPRWLRRLMGDLYLTKANKIYLGWRRIPRQALQGCGRVRKLERLSLQECQLPLLNDWLPRCRHLRGLVLVECDVRDQHLRAVGGQSRLRELSLTRNPAISSAGIRHLVGLRLESLTLHGTSVDDEAVDLLCRMSTLRLLDLTQTRISRDGVKRLRQSLPDTDVYSIFFKIDDPRSRGKIN